MHWSDENVCTEFLFENMNGSDLEGLSTDEMYILKSVLRKRGGQL
jgi:hypothetical protein